MCDYGKSFITCNWVNSASFAYVKQNKEERDEQSARDHIF